LKLFDLIRKRHYSLGQAHNSRPSSLPHRGPHASLRPSLFLHSMLPASVVPGSVPDQAPPPLTPTTPPPFFLFHAPEPALQSPFSFHPNSDVGECSPHLMSPSHLPIQFRACQRTLAVIGLRRIAAALHCSGDSHLRAHFPSSPRLWHVDHLPHLLSHPQESSELIAGDHAPPPLANVPAPDRTIASAVLRRSVELHCLPSCPAGRSCPTGTLSRLSSLPCWPSCRRWSRHRASPMRGAQFSTRARRTGVVGRPRSFAVWVGLPQALASYQVEPVVRSAGPRPWARVGPVRYLFLFQF
jgi:hypothetical protein